MLRFTVHSSPAAAAAYYGSGHDYLAEEQAAVWGGDFARRLGLSGEVTREQFARLADGRNPLTDESLLAIRRDTRRAGTDLTWSAPKSVALAYELSGDERVVSAFRDAVEATMRDIEREVQARVRVGGEQDVRTTGNAAWATFVHRTSRPVNGVPDPFLHAHSFLFSVTADDVEAGKVKAVELGDARRDANYWEAVMLSRLAKSMTELGYAVKRDGRFFTLDGVDKPLVEKFSRRTQLIERVAEERGVERPEWKAELGGKTRERKRDGLSESAMKAEWRGRLTPDDARQLDSLRGRESHLPDVADSARFALEHVFERSSLAASRKVAEVALRHGFGSATVEEVWPALHANGLVTRRDQATTRRALKREAVLVAVAREGKGALNPIERRPTGLPKSLTAGQRDAVKHILTSKDRVTLVRGAAGVGKTTLLAEVVRHTKLPVRAVAVTGSAAEELQSVTPNASTVARFLLDEEQQKAVAGGVVIVDEASLLGTEQAATLFRLAESLDARLLLVGDLQQHASVTAGSPFRAVQELAGLPCAEVTEVVRQRGLYKAVAETLGLGRTDDALDLLDGMGHVHEMQGDERLAALADDYLAAVRKGDTVLCVAPTHAELAKVNHAVREALKADGHVAGDEITLTRLVPANLTQAELKDGHALPERGVVQFTRSKGKHKAGDRLPVAALDAETQKTGYFAAYTEAELTLAKGDTVRITAAGKDVTGKHKLLTGSTYRVAKLSDRGVELDNGWTVSKSFGHWNHGYATTSVSSQSKTVDVVLVSEPAASLAAAGREQAYVSLTRGRSRAAVYTDDLPALREAVTRDRGKSNAHDLLDPTPANPARERATVLARLATVAKSAKARVSQLKHLYRKEKHYDLER